MCMRLLHPNKTANRKAICFPSKKSKGLQIAGPYFTRMKSIRCFNPRPCINLRQGLMLGEKKLRFLWLEPQFPATIGHYGIYLIDFIERSRATKRAPFALPCKAEVHTVQTNVVKESNHDEQVYRIRPRCER